MKFKSIREVIEKTGANAKAAECLGKSGALSNLDEDFNELESAEYAKSFVSFLRERERYIQRLEKYEETIRTKEEKFREKVEERRIKQEAKDQKYRERLIKYEKKFAEVKEKNLIRAEKNKKLLKEPEKPVEPRQLVEITYPNIPKEPEPPKEPLKPKVLLSSRERIRLQREMLHLYLSGHPLDEVAESKDVTNIKNLSESDSKSWHTIRGVLQSLKVTNTRTKKLMARLRIEDKTGSIEVVAFPKVYESLKGSLLEGELYEILGRLDITKKELDTGEEFSHIQFIGTRVQQIRIGSDKEWSILYPLLKGNLHILPSKAQKSKGQAERVLTSLAQKNIEETFGQL
jgi:DNA polymerase III alpha subunit